MCVETSISRRSKTSERRNIETPKREIAKHGDFEISKFKTEKSDNLEISKSGNLEISGRRNIETPPSRNHNARNLGISKSRCIGGSVSQIPGNRDIAKKNTGIPKHRNLAISKYPPPPPPPAPKSVSAERRNLEIQKHGPRNLEIPKSRNLGIQGLSDAENGAFLAEIRVRDMASTDHGRLTAISP